VERATVSTSVTGTATLYLPLVSDVNDDSSSPRTMAAVGGAAISSAQKKFGAGSLYLDGVNDNLSISGTDWDFGTTNFTIDGWFYCTEDSSSTFLHIISTNATAGWNLCVKPSLKRIQFYENGTAFGADSCWTLNTWHHVAVVRQSTNLSVYVDGTSIVSTTISASEEFNTDAGSGGGVIFGAQWGGGSPFEGYLQDWRVLRGVVCYTANFIVPRVPRGDDNANGNVTKTYTYAIANKWNSGVWSLSESSGEGYSVNHRRKAEKWKSAAGARFYATQPLSCDLLVISGGGSGGTGSIYSAGGAGGGGMLTGTETFYGGTTYNVTVGAGASLMPAGPRPGPVADGRTGGVGNGGVSQIGTVENPASMFTTVGGGGSYSAGDSYGGGRPGGSGGGSPGYGSGLGVPAWHGDVGAGTGSGPTLQGYPGGTGTQYGCGGGGGAGGVGGNGSGDGLGGTGGVGRSWPVNSTTYAGGGGGGNGNADPGSYGQPGPGGGGRGNGGRHHADTPSTQPQPSMNGTANLGGGGGGLTSPRQTGGLGGSGIVIISFPTASGPPTAAGGTVSTVGSLTLHTFTTSGTFTAGMELKSTVL